MVSLGVYQKLHIAARNDSCITPHKHLYGTLKCLLTGILIISCLGQSCAPTPGVLLPIDDDEQVLGDHPANPNNSTLINNTGTSNLVTNPDNPTTSFSNTSGLTEEDAGTAPTDPMDSSDPSETPSDDSSSTEADDPPLPPVYARIVVVPAMERVFRENVDIAGESFANLQAARGETESCQIVIVNEGDTPIQNIGLQCPQPVPGADPRPVLTPYRVHYVEVTQPSYDLNSALGWYPDSLIPFVNPYTCQYPDDATYRAAGYTVPVGRCQPYWIDVTIPRGTPAGTYDDVITITADGFSQEIAVQTTVWNFELPEAPALPMYLGVAQSKIQELYGTGSDLARLKTLVDRHNILMLEHRLPNTKLPAVPYDLNSGHAVPTAAYLNQVQDHLAKYPTRVVGIPLAPNWPFADWLGAGETKLKKYLKDIDQMLKDNPWIPPAYIYILDEPRTYTGYQQVVQFGDMLDSQNLDIMNLVTGALKPIAGWPSLDNSIDIWVYNWGYWNDLSVATRKAQGKQVWAYFALTTSYPVPMWELDVPLVNYMAPFWTAWTLHLDGMFYWTALCSSSLINPWEEAITFRLPDGLEYNGEGSLMLPGVPAGIEGPVPTIRLKVIRDSLEMYDYLAILAEAGGQGAADGIAAGLTTSFTSWSRDYQEYLAARQAVADEILARQP